GLDLPQQVGLEPASAQTHHIEPVDACGAGDTEGRHIAGDATAAGDHGALAQAHELMHHGPAAQEHKVCDLDMSAEQHGVGHDHPVTDLAVVRHVTCGHEEAVRSDARRSGRLGGTVDGDMLADHGARADVHFGGRLVL